MSISSSIFPIVGMVLVATLFVAFLLAAKSRYLPRAVMTPNETEFFHRLERAHLGNGYVFPQVGLGALMQPKARGRAGLTAFRKISQKRVDYSVHAPDLSLVCVVELDDRTHDARKDAARDRLLREAGIHTLRWDSSRRPSVAEIRAELKAIAARHPSGTSGGQAA